jgi:hypothetical protein
MKNLLTTVFCACIMVCGLYSSAQTQKFVLNEPNYNKPHSFDNLPETIPVSVDNLNNLVNSKTGVKINTVLSSDAKIAPFEGTVISAISKYDDKVQTVFIRSANYNGATLYISKVMREDGTIKYNGRLMTDFQHGDLFVLQQKDGGFALVKKSFYYVINE